MSLLVKRELFSPRLNRAAARRTLEPTETWMGLFMPGDKQIGYLSVRTVPEWRGDVPGAKMAMTAELSMTLLGRPTEIFIIGSGWAPAGNGRSDFDFRVQSGEHRIRVEGSAGEGVLDAVVHTGGEAIPFQAPIDEDMTFWSALTPGFDVADLKPGKEYSTDAFDPVTMSMGRARVAYVGREVLEIGDDPIETTVVSIEMSGFTSRAWLGPDGDVVRAETPFGFTLMQIPPAQATIAAGDDLAGDLIAMSAVPATGKTVRRGAARMRVKLTGFPQTVTVPTDDTQSAAEDDTFTISRPSPPEQGVMTPLDDPGLEPFLDGDVFIQVDHDDIRQTVADIVGNETDPWNRALLLYDWVFENVEKEPVFSVPSALEVLTTMEGDCNEHTILFTALARCAGIPTRIALGVVWSEEFDAFYYHAWPEVYIGRWIWMDPTLGQPVADATHIKLVTGGIDKWFRLVSYLGNLEIQVLDIELHLQGNRIQESSARDSLRISYRPITHFCL